MQRLSTVGLISDLCSQGLLRLLSYRLGPAFFSSLITIREKRKGVRTRLEERRMMSLTWDSLETLDVEGRVRSRFVALFIKTTEISSLSFSLSLPFNFFSLYHPYIISGPDTYKNLTSFDVIKFKVCVRFLIFSVGESASHTDETRRPFCI